MKTHISQGWRLTFKHFHLVLLLFVYQFGWGFFLYRIIDQTVTPVLRRFPDSGSSEQAMRHFVTEAQIQLFKTDLVAPYLWMLGGLFAARMLLTPLFNAGFFYSFHEQTRSGGKSRFLEGIKRTWRPILLLYAVQAVLTAAPGIWLVPRGLTALIRSGSYEELALTLLPGILVWVVWGALLHLLFLAMQVGAVSGEGIFSSLWRSMRGFLPYAGLSLVMWGIGAAIALAVSSMSLVWAGLIALIVHQSYYLVKTLMKVWTVAAQYDCLLAK
ncbi:hypothetical protein RB620_11980 [Paenibacillus sp. LHD-117]|uniref:hypothetical protein n=1 Tax=Paenibacillus sp. LHD-117 TaxID=3071412 RepID=UPI0027DECC93|nr:hypothetical protein [Paenibacillus sp. LHD-117]MDQ6420157.1 hypothetical protein [Paenibacillus sp. LHD-117]